MVIMMEIFTVNTRGEVFRLDVEGDVLTEEFLGDTDIVEPGAIAVADLDRDGVLEYIIGPRNSFSSQGNLTIYNFLGPQWFYERRSYPIVDVEEIELADVNGDSFLDVIQSPQLNNGSLVIDGLTFNPLHNVNTIAGLIEVADLDVNGTLEIVNVQGSVMRVFDAQSLDLINSFELEDGVESLCVAELDGNPGLEALVGSNPLGTGDIYCYNPLTDALLWKKNNIGHATELSNIKTFDIDKDGATEIVFGALDAHSGVLVAMDTTGNIIEYESMDFLYPVSHRIVQSPNNSGAYELFLLTNEYRGSETAKVLRQFSLDNFSMVNEWELITNINFSHGFDIARMRAVDEFEWVLAEPGKIYFFNPNTGTEVLPRLSFNARINKTLIRDINGNGLSELIVFTYDGLLRIFELTNGEFVEHASSEPILELVTSTAYLETGQLDDDDALELVVSHARELLVIDLSTFEIQQTISNSIDFFGNFVVADPDHDGAPDIYTFSGLKKLFKVDLLAEEVTLYKTLESATYVDNKIAIGHFLSDTQEHLLVTDGNRIFFVSPEDLTIVQENKSIAFVTRQISVMENVELGIDGFVLGTDAGAYVFQVVKPGSLCTEDDLVISGTATDNTIEWGIQTLTSTATIPAGKITHYKAGNAIRLLPGFSAQAGSKFTAIIETCDAPTGEPPYEDLGYYLPSRSEIDFTVYPNPIDQTTRISWILEEESEVNINLYSISGALIRNVTTKTFSRGQHSLDVDLGELPPGMYVIAMQAGSLLQARKVVVN